MLTHFFQIGSIPADQMLGSYDLRLVLLSYLVAVFVSFIALDITGRLRDVDNTKLSSTLWLLGGAFAMGAGIWAMHFIGMLAFKLPLPMSYDATLTVLSMLVAVLASAFALLLLRSKTLKIWQFALGGIILGLAIASMHYVGMAAMDIDMSIHYLPSLFMLSIIIAITASEVALWLAIKSNQGPLKLRVRLKVISAFIMGAAICGMHYMGMAAAIFTPLPLVPTESSQLSPEIMSIGIAVVSIFILGLAFAVSTYKEVLNFQAVKLAHQSGMAEVAANVLHNVGNVLNSVNVSASMVVDKLNKSELAGLESLSQLMQEHKEDLAHFLATDPRAAELPNYLIMLADYWAKERSSMVAEMKVLIGNVQHIRDVITTQQTLGGILGSEQMVLIADAVEAALVVTNIDFNRTKIVLDRHYDKLAPFMMDKIKLLQILINLIRNAKHSLLDSTEENKLLSLRIENKNNEKVIITVRDNGVGIAAENVKKIFTHGFTTKKGGHGFGLHASAIYAKEMGGSLQVQSEGVGKGATFILELPCHSSRVKDLKSPPQRLVRQGEEYAEH